MAVGSTGDQCPHLRWDIIQPCAMVLLQDFLQTLQPLPAEDTPSPEHAIYMCSICSSLATEGPDIHKTADFSPRDMSSIRVTGAPGLPITRNGHSLKSSLAIMGIRIGRQVVGM